MLLTLKLIENQAAQSRAAHLMRLLSEDVLAALRAGTLPAGDGCRLVWNHPCGAQIVITEGNDDPDSYLFCADIHAPGVCVSGGFSFYDEGAADLLDFLIEGGQE